MKAFINSLRSTHWFNLSMTLISCLSFLSLPFCQKDELNQDTIPDISPSVLFQKGKPTITVGKIKDVDGNWYKTVKIGEQWWMAENLKTIRYLNHDLIETTNPPELDISLESTPKYQWAVNANENNVATYGRLYTWYVVTDSRKICPRGWHVPAETDWNTLTNYLGVDGGGKLKEAGFTHWIYPNTGATNETGFTALPNGSRTPYGFFGTNIDWGSAYLWSDTEYIWDATSAYSFILFYSYSSSSSNYLNKKWGCSIRCVKD
jgi:uncharacterized protein (TIGR02145 family)